MMSEKSKREGNTEYCFKVFVVQEDETDYVREKDKDNAGGAGCSGFESIDASLNAGDQKRVCYMKKNYYPRCFQLLLLLSLLRLHRLHTLKYARQPARNPLE